MKGCAVQSPTQPGRAPVLFEVKVAETGRAAFARVDGPLSGDHCPCFLARVQPLCSRLRRVVVDLRRAQYIDSSGVRALLLLQDELAGHGELRLILQPGSPVERTLSLLCLMTRFQTYDSASEAWARRHAAA